MDGALRCALREALRGTLGDVPKLPLPCAILLSKISDVERTVGEKEKLFFLLYFLCSLPCLPF